jgi:hypothetical protein
MPKNHAYMFSLSNFPCFFRLQNDKYNENVNKSFSKIWSQSFGGGPSVRKNIALPNQKMSHWFSSDKDHILYL